VYNILGSIVAEPVSKNLSAGNHQYRFNAADLASGVYYYELTTAAKRDVKKMILLK
jgi:hypothetical protein